MGEKKGNLPGKIRDVLVPFAVYYAVFMAAFFLLSCGLQMLAGISGNGVQADDAGTTAAAVRKLLEEHGETVTGIVNGISMLTGAAFLLPMFRAELQMRKSGGTIWAGRRGCTVSDSGLGGRLFHWTQYSIVIDRTGTEFGRLPESGAESVRRDVWCGTVSVYGDIAAGGRDCLSGSAL